MADFSLRSQPGLDEDYQAVLVDGYAVGRVIEIKGRFTAFIDSSIMDGPFDGVSSERAPGEIADFATAAEAGQAVSDYLHDPLSFKPQISDLGDEAATVVAAESSSLEL